MAERIQIGKNSRVHLHEAIQRLTDSIAASISPAAQMGVNTCIGP
jgi:hypothetical protein